MKEPIVYLNYLAPESLHHSPHVTITWFVMGLFILLGMALKGSMNTMAPKGLHNLVEAVIIGLYEFADSIMGKEGRKYFPLIGTLALFILVSNLIGLVPGFVSPTANLNTNAAMALIVFFLYNYVGLKEHGTHYLKGFLGPVPLMAPMMLPIEIISHLARPLTLSLRLFGNIRGEELIILVLGFLIPLFLPMPMLAFAVFTSVLQSVVFILLTMVYIAGALEEPH
ncbi:MAG: F0F1 ATP synthase subunit A [Nitrospinae bacterium]|nr:F0F1 ATP synthase subunit A [Nitrospinota bacterium]